MEQVNKKMMEELEEFDEEPFHIAMELFNEGNFPEMDYYRVTHGIDNDSNVFLKIIKHINGDPQFEEEKPKKYVIKYKELDYDDDPWFITFNDAYNLKKISNTAKISNATVFDTKEEAEKWTNPQTEVIEVEG